jgi:hypothetical protein
MNRVMWGAGTSARGLSDREVSPGSALASEVPWVSENTRAILYVDDVRVNAW